MSGIVTLAEDSQILTTDEYLTEDARLRRTGARIADGAITDSMAQTIAAWWMAPDTELSRLVHMREADAEDLISEIDREIREITNRRGWIAADHELFTLRAWMRYTAEPTDD